VSISSHTETAACKVAPNARMKRFNSLRGLGQFKGSFGSSEGWGAKTIWAFLPVPCFNNPVTASVCAAFSFSRTVPGTCPKWWSKDLAQFKRKLTFKDSKSHAAPRDGDSDPGATLCTIIHTLQIEIWEPRSLV
jgi:hypothetical protein